MEGSPLTYVPKAVVRHEAPDFEADAYHEFDFKKVKLSDYRGKYVVLFFYPLDFTFVCPTEIVAYADAAKSFRESGCEVIGVSVDSKFCHMEYCLKERKKGGLGELDIPLVSDLSKQISKDYGVLIDHGDDNGVSFRGTFIIDTKGIIRHI